MKKPLLPMSGLVDQAQSTVTKQARYVSRQLGCFNATSFMETLYSMVYTSIGAYLVVTLIKEFRVDLDTVLLTSMCYTAVGVVVLWFAATGFNFKKYVRDEKMVTGTHYNPVIVHLIYAGATSSILTIISVLYSERYVHNTNPVEQESGTMVRGLIYGFGLGCLPLELALYVNSFFTHRNPNSFQITTVYLND